MPHNMFVGSVRWSGFGTVEKVRMVTTFTQLHEDVLESHLFKFSSTVHDIDISHKNLGVHLALHFTKSNIDFHFFFGFQSLFYFSLETTEQERPQNGMETLNEGIITKAVVCIEPFVEILQLKVNRLV